MNEQNKDNVAETATNTPQRTYEQKQLDVLYDEFNQKLRGFYDGCKILIDESSEENRRLSCKIEAQEKELEEAQKRRSARNLLDGMGRAFARLFNTIYSLPSEISAKQNLCKCLDTISDELKNRAITLIYDPRCDMMRDKNYKCIGTLSASDKELIGEKRVIDKVGFLIENEEIIPAEYYEYKKEKDGRTSSPDEEYVQSYPFTQNKDWKLSRGQMKDGRIGLMLQITSKNMRQEFKNNMGICCEELFLNVRYGFPGGTAGRYRSPSMGRHEGNRQFEFHAYKVFIKEGILYLDLYQIVPNGYGNETNNLIAEFPLAEIQY